MSKAPLEARLRQREDTFLKERERLLAENEALAHSERISDEKCRELRLENEALGELIKKMRLEAREASSGTNGDGERDAWNERLRSNRENAALRSNVMEKEEMIRTLKMEKGEFFLFSFDSVCVLCHFGWTKRIDLYFLISCPSVTGGRNTRLHRSNENTRKELRRIRTRLRRIGSEQIEK